MIDANKTYGFTIAVKELRETVPNIFRYASAYKRLKGLKSKGLWEMFVDPVEKKEEPVTDQSPLPEEVLRADPNRNNLPDIDPEAMEGESYNMCHFWSNFEIASLDWFRGKEYEEFFEMMDRSGGFWMERVSPHDAELWETKLTLDSGVMPPSTPWQPAPSSLLATSTTSVTLDTDTPLSSTARPMRQPDSCLDSPTSRRQLLTRRSVSRKTSTGKTGTLRRRTVSDADADATQTLSTSRARRDRALLNGSMLPVDGPARKCNDNASHTYTMSRAIASIRALAPVTEETT